MVTIVNKKFVEDYREAISGKVKTMRRSAADNLKNEYNIIIDDNYINGEPDAS